MINVKRDIKEAFIRNLTISASSTSASSVFITGKAPEKQSDLPAAVFSLNAGGQYQELGFCGFIENKSVGASYIHPVLGYSYQGNGTIEIIALSALEKDKAYDSLVNILMFSADLRDRFSQDSLLLLKQTLTTGGEQETPFEDESGDKLYSDTMQFGFIGEVYYDSVNYQKVEAINLIPYYESQGDPQPEW